MTPDKIREREEALRPSRFLGFNHHILGKHLYSIGCFQLAAQELERAVWLNPYETKFLLPLAWSYFRLGKKDSAQETIEEYLKKYPHNDEAEKLLELLSE